MSPLLHLFPAFTLLLNPISSLSYSNFWLFSLSSLVQCPQWLVILDTITCYLLVTCVVMDFSRLSIYCPYPMAFQSASRRFLKLLTEVASTTCWGRLFQELITIWLKKFFLRSRRDLFKDSFYLENPHVTSVLQPHHCSTDRLPELTSLTARSVAPLLPSGTLWTLILCAATL